MATGSTMPPQAPSAAEPVFVVGCGRSGTTLLYELLSNHPDVCWVSNYSDRLPLLSVMQRPLPARLTKTLPERLAHYPVEGYRSWDRLLGSDFHPLEANAAEGAIGEIQSWASRHCQLSGRSVFLNKNTRNSRRIRALREVFPQARWIHMVRDPRAVALSLTRVTFWPALRAWWRDGSTVEQLVAQGHDSLSLAAECWVAEVGRCVEDLATVAGGRHVVVEYESLTAKPERTLAEVCEAVELQPAALLAGTPRGSIQNRNGKSLERLTSHEIEMIAGTCGELATAFGYTLR